MSIHANELIKWNKRINLTAIKDPLKVAEKHFIDSIAATAYLKNENTLVDVGSGGGFPGIPIKIMNPSLSIVLIDSSQKKVNFLKHIIRTLNLKDIEAIHSRIEDLHENKNYKNQFDAVISRAFTQLENFVSLALPLIKDKGTLYAMKGKNAEMEITSKMVKQYYIHSNHYQLPLEQSDRYIIQLKNRY